MKYNKVICLISDQSIPNYLPISNIKSITEIVLISSQAMDKKTIDFVETLRKYKPNILWHKIKIENEKNLQALTSELEQKLKHHIGNEVLANVTCGTKVMSIALSNWATNQKIDIAYIDKNDLQIINFTTKKFEQDKLTKQLSINEYLSMYGSYVYENSSAPTDNEIKFVNHLVHYYNDYQLKELHKSYQNNSQIVDNEYITLMNEYNIPEKSQRVLITGRWLEIFIYITLLQKLGDRQVGFGLKLANRHNFPEGEQLEKSKHIIKDYDVIFVYNNKLHIIECKTSIKPEPLDSSSDVLEHMFKLQTLTDPKNFGLFAGKYYATNYAISDNLKSQAEQYGIKHITGFISGQLSLLEKQNKLLTLLDVK